MLIQLKIILGNSQHIPEIDDSTRPADDHFSALSDDRNVGRPIRKTKPQIATLWRELKASGEETSVKQIYNAMHKALPKSGAKPS